MNHFHFTEDTGEFSEQSKSAEYDFERSRGQYSSPKDGPKIGFKNFKEKKRRKEEEEKRLVVELLKQGVLFPFFIEGNATSPLRLKFCHSSKSVAALL